MQVVENAKRNLTFGVINKAVTLFIPFIERHVLLNILGSQYLGLGSLFQSIIEVLSLSELGFSSAMVYNMYKPAAEGNTGMMNALLNFYRKVYRIIGCVILVIGLALIPFLPRLIKGSYPIGLTEFYLIYLVNAVLSYFLYAYRSVLIVVHQRDDVNSTINSIIRIGLMISRIAVLVLTKDYFLFTLLMPFFTVLNNLLIAFRTKQLFPQYKAEGKLSPDYIAGIRKVVAGTFINQACHVTRNSLDSVCVSAFLGLTLTAVYNNYYLILNGVIKFMGIYTASLMGGVGNHVATKSVEDNFEEMKKLDFVNLWLGGWFAICLLCLYQPFMKLWMGEGMLLPFSAVILFCGYFYLLKLGDVRYMYNSANGLWWEQRHRAIGETVLNLILNFALGKLFGVHGIILATMISLFLCNYLWAAGITFRHYFGMPRLKQYYTYQGKQFLIMAAGAAVTYFLCSALPPAPPVILLIVRAMICGIVPNLFFYLCYRKTKNFQYVKGILFKKTGMGRE